MTIEEVRGTVIGTKDDTEAIKWFSEEYPEHYEAGAEMRNKV